MDFKLEIRTTQDLKSWRMVVVVMQHLVIGLLMVVVVHAAL